MTKAFIERVKREGTVDTKNYRYVCKIEDNKLVIERLPLEALDTTEVYSGWEKVYEE